MPTLDRLPPASHIPLPPAAVFVDRLSQGDRGGDQQKTIHSFDWWCRAPVSTGTDYPHLIFHTCKNKEPFFSDEHKQHLQGTEYIRIWHFNSEYDSCLQCLLNTSGWPYRCLGEVVREKTVLLSVLLSIKCCYCTCFLFSAHWKLKFRHCPHWETSSGIANGTSEWS